MNIDLNWDGDFWSADVYLDFLSRSINVAIVTDGEAEPPSIRQLLVLDFLKTISLSAKSHIEDHAKSYCEEFAKSVDFSENGIKVDMTNIQKHFICQRILIGSLENCVESYFSLSCECDWEVEHGMEVVFENKEIIYCGPNEGIVFFADSDEDYRNA